MSDRYLHWKAWDAAAFGRYTPEQARYFRLELARAGVASVRGLRVAELGFGNGEFAAWVRDQGGDWVGRETIGVLQQRAAEAGFAVVAPERTFAEMLGPGQVDLVVAWDVLEHLSVDEIRQVLADAQAVLAPGGRLVARLPSGDSPFAGATFYGDLTHRTLLGSKAIAQLVDEAGLAVRQMRGPATPLRGLAPLALLRRAAVWAVQGAVYGLIRRLLVNHPQAVIAPNMVVVAGKAPGREAAGAAGSRGNRGQDPASVDGPAT